MEEKICKNCRHFRQHYIKYGRSYSEISDGHCVHPRLKIRKSSTKACTYFSQRTDKNK